MKHIIRRIIINILKKYDEGFILITCSKTVDGTGNPHRWHSNTNISKVSDIRNVCRHVCTQYETQQNQEKLMKEVNNILTIKK